uniref:C6 domain-containing protein n=1 Tax=Haemonchus contortus TaxID=6289 RepID=A0A7I4YFT6_HAECO
MERLLLALVLIGTTLACSPVPEPKVKGKGHDVVYVTLVTNQTYNPEGVSTFLSDFSKTEIQQYSASVGNFSDLNCTNTDGYFTWTFKLTDANCSIVKAWVNQIVNSSSFYKHGETSCSNGIEAVYVLLTTNQVYDAALVDYDMEVVFNETHVKQYSASVGDFSDLNCTNVDGMVAYTFTLLNANCTKAKEWVNQMVKINWTYLLNGTVTCGYTWTPASSNENLIEITTPAPTTTTAIPLVILPGGALYQSDYEETVEHVEESVSSFESMPIMNI